MSMSLIGTIGLATYIACKPITPPLTAKVKGKEISITEIKKDNYVTTVFEEDENWINVIVTYYSNTIGDCGKTDGVGANNRKLSRGNIAMPREYPFGTKLYLDGMGIYENQDIGGAIKRINDNTIKVDVYIPNVNQKYLNKLGKKKVKGKIIK